MQKPSRFKRRNDSVFAMQHDGSNKSATKIENWILVNGGKCEVFLSDSNQFESDDAYIRLASQRSANLVVPGSWVVRVQEGLFYAVLDADFHILYVEAD